MLHLILVDVVTEEAHVAGEIAQMVYKRIDAEVVAVLGILASIAGHLSGLLVERHLAHAVDGVVDVFTHVGHTVLGTLQHHATTKDATEVSTLNSVQQTSCIDRTDTPRGKSIFNRMFFFTHHIIII